MKTIRTSRPSIAVTLIAGLLSMGGRLQAQELPSPEEFFGFPMGADRQLARWDRLVEYYSLLAGSCERIQIDTLGPTTLENPFVALTISAPENLDRLDEIQAGTRRLSDGRGLTADEARRLAAEERTVVFITHNMHSTEIASSQTSAELVHRLATDDSPATLEILDNVVLVLVPSANPDGQIMIVDWYRRNVGTDFERAPMPWLYHHYAGHDNNRDFFMGALVETRYMMRLLYHDWAPQIYLDQHQRGSNGARMFVPPYPDPQNENLHPLLWQQMKFLGGGMVTDLQAAGKKGVLNSALYRIYGQEGALAVRYHNMVGMLTEAASAAAASPVTITRDELLDSADPGRGIPEYGFSMNLVDPWWGGEWTLGDIVDYQMITAMSVLKQAARYRSEFLYNQWLMASDMVARGKEGGPFAYVIPASQRDPLTAADMVSRLLLQGIEVHRAESSFTIDAASESEARSFPAGSYVVLAGQAARPAVMDVLDRRALPIRHLYPEGPLLRMYDAAGYTLPMQMGVDVVRADSAFEARLVRIDSSEPDPVSPLPEAAVGYVLDPTINRTFQAVNRLLGAGVPVRRVTMTGDPYAGSGAFVIPASAPGAHEALEGIAGELGLHIGADPVGLGSHAGDVIRSARIGLYQGWAGSMDEGWTRLVFDDFEFPYATLMDEDIHGGGLADVYDVIIVPAEIRLSRLIDGRNSEDTPEEFAGGIGESGVDSLRQFVKDGGTLITLGDGDRVVLEHFDVPVKEALGELSEADFYLPTSLVAVDLDPQHSLSAGLPDRIAAKFSRGRAYVPTGWAGDRQVRVVGSYAPVDELLMSGLIVGPEHVAGRAAVVDVSYGEGRILMYGIRVQHRAQTHGTFKLLFNALYETQR